MLTLAPASIEVKSDVLTKSGYSVTSWPLVEFFFERDIDATLDASWAAFLAEEDADADQWSDDYADEMAGMALAESRLESGLLAW